MKTKVSKVSPKTLDSVPQEATSMFTKQASNQCRNPDGFGPRNTGMPQEKKSRVIGDWLYEVSIKSPLAEFESTTEASFDRAQNPKVKSSLQTGYR